VDDGDVTRRLTSFDRRSDREIATKAAKSSPRHGFVGRRQENRPSDGHQMNGSCPIQPSAGCAIARPAASRRLVIDPASAHDR
jgi:hypothetical protein